MFHHSHHCRESGDVSDPLRAFANLLTGKGRTLTHRRHPIIGKRL
jgi:hypothetical protein